MPRTHPLHGIIPPTTPFLVRSKCILAIPRASGFEFDRKRGSAVLRRWADTTPYASIDTRALGDAHCGSCEITCIGMLSPALAKFSPAMARTLTPRVPSPGLTFISLAGPDFDREWF